VRTSYIAYLLKFLDFRTVSF